MFTEDTLMEETEDMCKNASIEAKEQNEQLMVQFTSETGKCHIDL